MNPSPTIVLILVIILYFACVVALIWLWHIKTRIFKAKKKITPVVSGPDYLCNKTLQDFTGRTCFTAGKIYMEDHESSNPEQYLSLIDDMGHSHHVTLSENKYGAGGWREYFKEVKVSA